MLRRPALAIHSLCVGDSWPSFASAFSVISMLYLEVLGAMFNV
jgi:hypothetical protein